MKHVEANVADENGKGDPLIFCRHWNVQSTMCVSEVKTAKARDGFTRVA